MGKRKGSRKAQKSPAEPGPSVSTPAVSKSSKRYLQSSISSVEGNVQPGKSESSYWETEEECDTEPPGPFTSDEIPEVVREAPALSEDVQSLGRAFALDNDFPQFEEEKASAPPPSPPPEVRPQSPPSSSSQSSEAKSQPPPSQSPESEPSWFTEQIAAIEDEMKRRREAGPQPEAPRPIPARLTRGYSRFDSRLLRESSKYQRIRYGPEAMEQREWRQFPLLKRTPEEEEKRREIFASPFVSEYIGFGVFFGLRRHPCFEENSTSDDSDGVMASTEHETAETSDEESESFTPKRYKRVRFKR